MSSESTQTLVFIEKMKKLNPDKHYDYSKVTYTGMQQPVTVNCLEHGSWTTRAFNLIHNKSGCPICGQEKLAAGRRITQEMYLSRCVNKHGDRYDYSEVVYLGSRRKIVIICKEHGRFEQRAADHLFGDNCPECALAESVSKRRMTRRQFVEKAKTVHGEWYDYTDTYYGNNTEDKVLIRCREHGLFQITPHTHLQGQGCPLCRKKTVI